jgi:hypothetical protein
MICLIVCRPVAAQSLTSSQAVQTTTKLETLLLTKGSLLVKDFYPAGRFFGTGSAEIDVLLVSGVGSAAIAVKGLRVEVKESRPERSNTSFLDLEEIDDLVRAIDYFIALDTAVPQPPTAPPIQLPVGTGPHREATFVTKGGLSITCFGSQAQRRCAIESGRISPATMFIDGNQLSQLKATIEYGRTLLQAR